MTLLYKLTDKEWETRDHTKWGPGVEHTASGKGDLCGPGYLHAYTDPRLAVVFNILHANIRNPVLWEAAGEIARDDKGVKVGCTRLKTLQIIPLPEATVEQRVRFGILCARTVYHSPKWNKWAGKWLSGENRSRAAAYTAAKTIYALARTVYVTNTTYAAANAAYAAAYAAHAAAYAAHAAAYAAANAAANAAAYAAGKLDLSAIARKSMTC